MSLSVRAESLVSTVRTVKPSVVGVGTYLPTRRPPARFLGTGFVVGSGSLVVTNNHVVSVNMDTEHLEQLVVFSGEGSGAQIHKAKIYRVSDAHDLAILSVQATLPPMRLAYADRPPEELKEGESVAFTGFPISTVLGLYPATHRGIVSAITPIAIPSMSSNLLDARKIRRLRDPILVYQLDATAYPGNSGSPLYLPDTGEVVGILNMVFVKSTKEDLLSTPSGISYAIPVRHLRELLQGLEPTK